MQQIPEDIKALENKIAKIKSKTAEKESGEIKHTKFSHIAIGLRLGVELASGTIIGAALGYMLNEIFDFKFMLLVIFTIFGGCAGMLNAYRYIKSLDETEER